MKKIQTALIITGVVLCAYITAIQFKQAQDDLLTSRNTYVQTVCDRYISECR